MKIFLMIAHLVFPDGSSDMLTNVIHYQSQKECAADIPNQMAVLPDFPKGTVVKIECIEDTGEAA